MKHEAEENMLRSTVHNINIYIKHIILLLLEGLYCYSLCIIFFLFKAHIALQRNCLHPYGDDTNDFAQ